LRGDPSPQAKLSRLPTARENSLAVLASIVVSRCQFTCNPREYCESLVRSVQFDKAYENTRNIHIYNSGLYLLRGVFNSEKKSDCQQ